MSQKEQSSEKKIIEKKDQNKNGYFDTIVSLIKTNLIEEFVGGKKEQTEIKEFEGNGI